MSLSHEFQASPNESSTDYNTTEPLGDSGDNERVPPPVGIIIVGAILFGSKHSSNFSS